MTGVAFASPPYCYRCPFEKKYPSCDLLCARSIENVIEYGTSKGVAAFIAEPVMGEGGIIVPPTEYFTVVKEILDQYEILFIADEVQSGFARTGKFFGIEHFNVTPDDNGKRDCRWFSIKRMHNTIGYRKRIRTRRSFLKFWG